MVKIVYAYLSITLDSVNTYTFGVDSDYDGADEQS